MFQFVHHVRRDRWQFVLDAGDLKMRMARVAAFPAEEDAIQRGEEPSLDFGTVPQLATLGEQPRKRLLCQFAGVVRVARETVGEPV